jgi:hypothetical protein
MKRIPILNSELYAIVDDDDFEAASAYTWRLNEPHPGILYARATVGGVRVFLHRFIASRMGLSGDVIDHKFHFGLDNRRAGLRLATRGQNSANRRTKASSSGFPGVHKSKYGWIVRFVKDGKMNYFGLHKSIADAIAVAKSAGAVTHGEFSPISHEDSRAAEVAELTARIKELTRHN